MTDIKNKRSLFLDELYKKSEQDELKSCNTYELGATLEFDENTTDKIIRYFINEGLITKKPAKVNQPRGAIAITHSGICHVEATLEKRAQFFRELRKGFISKKGDPHHIKSVGNIVAGGDVIVGDKNIKKQDIPTIEKEKWHQNRTIQAALIGAFALILVSCVGWYIYYNSGETSNIFAYVSKDGTILRSNDFPWKITKTKTRDGKIIYIINGRKGEPTAISVFPDNSTKKYIVRDAYDGIAIVFSCPEEEISNFTIKLKY